MRNKYNFVVEGLKNAERFEYTCKMTAKYDDFFEEEEEKSEKKEKEIS